jgi:Chlorophyllase enzyme
MFIAFFCGAFCAAPQIANYTDKAAQKGYEIEVFLPDAGLFTANHSRDLQTYENSLTARIAKSTSPETKQMAFFGFSMGGKFAAKLAQTFDVKGVFLIDPVDGAPPFQKVTDRFPLFLQNPNPNWRDKGNGTASLTIINSSLGQKPGFGGQPCVPVDHGSQWFAAQLGAQTSEQTQIEDAGHLDMLSKVPGLGALVCPKGSDAKKAQDKAVQLFESFLNELG